MWDNWLTGLQTVLTLMRGVTDIPLIFVVRKDDKADPGDYFESFDEECIAKAPLLDQPSKLMPECAPSPQVLCGW